jgi:hypothetical protein
MFFSMAEEKIGEFLVRIKALTREQVEIILKKQKEEEPDKLFGTLVIELGYLDEDVLQKYIKSRKR